MTQTGSVIEAQGKDVFCYSDEMLGALASLLDGSRRVHSHLQFDSSEAPLAKENLKQAVERIAMMQNHVFRDAKRRFYTPRRAVIPFVLLI